MQGRSPTRGTYHLGDAESFFGVTEVGGGQPTDRVAGCLPCSLCPRDFETAPLAPGPRALAARVSVHADGVKHVSPGQRPGGCYLAGIFEKWECPTLIVGGYDDHVHSLFLLSKNHPLKKIVEEVKKGSSKWIKTLGSDLADFSWQNGYGAFSVSESNVPDVKKYIECQAKHHLRITFQDELRQLLARHGITAEERYLWS